MLAMCVPRTRTIIILVILWFRKKPVPIEQSKKFIYKAKMFENQRPRKKIINKLHQKKNNGPVLPETNMVLPCHVL